MIEALLKTMPKALGGMRTEISLWLKSELSAHLQTLDFVSREEFDVQVTRLHKAQAKCRALEEKVSQLASDAASDNK